MAESHDSCNKAEQSITYDWLCGHGNTEVSIQAACIEGALVNPAHKWVQNLLEGCLPATLGISYAMRQLLYEMYVNVHQVGVDLWQGVSMNMSMWTSWCVRTSNVCRIRLIDNALWKGRTVLFNPKRRRV